MARRARSADRGDEGVFYRLEEALNRALRQPEPRNQFKAPSFDGTGDVAFFISQFEDVAQANQWNAAATRIHLRASLTDTATACGQAEDPAQIFTALRARFGLTSREAKAKLATLRREPRTSLQEHAAIVERLVSTAYAELPRHNQHDMKLDTFQTSLGHPYLQRHLLAIQPRTLEDAVRAGNEFLQVQTFPMKSAIRQVEGEEEEEGQARQVADPMQALLKAVAQLAAEVSSLKATPHPNYRQSPSTPSTGIRCYGCNRSGHLRRDCKTKPWPTSQAGNEGGPQ